MEVARNPIKDLRQFVYELAATPFKPVVAHHLQRLNEWIADSKQALMHRIAHLATSPIRESRVDEQLMACLLAVANLANRTYRTMHDESINHPQQQQLLALVLSGLHELIDYAEFECGSQFPKAIPIPMGLLLSPKNISKRVSCHGKHP